MPLFAPLDMLKDLKAIYNDSRSGDAKIKTETKNKMAKAYIVLHDKSDMFVRERVTQRLKQIMTNYNAGVERYIFGKNNMQEWIDSLYDMPMFNPLRLVIASELYELKEEDLALITGYLKKPSPDVVLLLLSAQKLDKRKKRFNSIFDHATACTAEITTKGKDTTSSWVKGFAAERGKQIEDSAVEFLSTRYKDDLSRMEKEIEKVSVYIGQQNTINQKDIEYVSTGVSSVSVFDIYPPLASKNKKKLLEVVYRFLMSGENPVVINSLISGRIRKLLAAADSLKENPKMQDSELAEIIGMKPQAVYFVKSELRNYKREELANMYKRCMNIDAELKSMRGDKKDILISGITKLLERR
ncbi:MAG: DNA polymerase III subunit delta [Pseudomonadota bacterium]